MPSPLPRTCNNKVQEVCIGGSLCPAAVPDRNWVWWYGILDLLPGLSVDIYGYGVIFGVMVLVLVRTVRLGTDCHIWAG